MKEKSITLFYSWQSDLPDATNRRLIREALRAASSRLEAEVALGKGLRIVLDEATRNRPGSPNIPLTILEKIEAADIFVADITTINDGVPSTYKRTPNPNVLVELGYAVAHLGWGRIIMLFNRAYGKFPDDAPFDIDRHRASPYEFRNDITLRKSLPSSNQSVAKQAVVDLLYTAIKSIIEHNPNKARDTWHLSPSQAKRQRDNTTLLNLLRVVHIPTLDEHIREAPHRISERLFFFWDYF